MRGSPTRWRRISAGADGAPVLVVWPVLPRWLPEHGTAILDDLAAGCEASVAPVFDGGLYLLALARQHSRRCSLCPTRRGTAPT